MTRSFRPTIAPTFIAVWVVSATAVCVAILSDGTPRVAQAVVAIVASGALAYAVAHIARQMFTIVLTPEGIEAADVSGRRAKVAWSEVADVKPLNIPGHGYVRVNLTGRRSTLWLPAYLENREQFVAAVKEIAGADHPLVREFSRQTARG